MNTNVYNVNETIKPDDIRANYTKNLGESYETLNRADSFQREFEKGASAIANPEGFKPNLNADNNRGQEAKWHPHIDFNEEDSRKYVLGSVEHEIDRKVRAHGK